MRVSVVLCRNVMLFVGLFNRITVCGTCVSVSTCRTWNAPPAAWSLSRPRILQASLPPPSPPADLAVYNRNPTALPRAHAHPSPAPLFSRAALVLSALHWAFVYSLIVCPSLRT